ncbi:MAG: hypothetical protein ACW97A_14820 [Candidatus Thorarchaeota archaeon]
MSGSLYHTEDTRSEVFRVIVNPSENLALPDSILYTALALSAIAIVTLVVVFMKKRE